MKKISLFLFIYLFIVSFAHAAVIKIATVAPEGTAWMKEMRTGAEEIKKRTEGRVEIKYYPGGVMGDPATVLRKIKIGQLQGGAFTGGEFSVVDKNAQIYSFPFLFSSLEEVDHVRSGIDPLVKASIRQAGFEAVALTGGGFAYVMSVQDIRDKDGLKAAKVWVPQGDHIAELSFKAGGVTPIPLPLADVYTSLQTGLIDTAANTTAGAIAFQWHTKLKHMVDLPVTYVLGIVAIDAKIFDGLSTDDQKIVKEELGAAFSRLESINKADNASARDALQKQGITIFTPNAEQKKSWLEVGENARKQLMLENAISLDLLNTLIKNLDEFRAGKIAK